MSEVPINASTPPASHAYSAVDTRQLRPHTCRAPALHGDGFVPVPHDRLPGVAALPLLQVCQLLAGAVVDAAFEALRRIHILVTRVEKESADSVRCSPRPAKACPPLPPKASSRARGCSLPASNTVSVRMRLA